MPRLAASRRRRRAEMEEEDNDGGGGDSDDVRNGVISPVASDASKRRRLDSESESDGDVGLSSQTTTRRYRNASSGAGDSMQDFQPGAIVRVSVQNFVTYEEAEFFPGPHLNMVIGPNGTGKSSLVCAICLGLGYSPKHLGRAGHVKEFVKHGKDHAMIEIELFKKPEDRNNYVIKVQIRREQNTQKWWLNGKETSQKRIQDLMRSLRIQVDNLCQFLPQDRVVEFAACTPVDLLHETLRAAAPEEMLEWQRQLQGMHKEKRELVDAAATDGETLQNLEKRQQGLQADVDRIRERQEIQEKAEDLRSALVLAKYQEARASHQEARQRKKEAEQALRRLESERGPSLEAVNEKQDYAAQVEGVVPVMEKAVQSTEQATQRLALEISAATEEVKELNDKRDAEQKGFTEKRKDLANSKSKITAFQADMKNRPSEFNAAEWNARIRAEEHKLRDLVGEQRLLSVDMNGLRDRATRIQAEEKQMVKEMQDLDTQQGQQESFMRKHFPEVAAAWEWIQGNQGEFEREVLGPPMISCSVKDERYSDLIQALLQKDDFLCFTAQSKNDYKKLTNQLYRVMSLSVVVRTCAIPLSAFQPPVGADEAAALGLDGFALNFVTGPDAVLAMLCAEKRLHQSGVALKEHGDEAYDRLISSGKVNQWAAGRQAFTIRRRREYGPKAMTTVTKNIQTGNFWTSQPVGDQEREDLKQRTQAATEQRHALKEEHRSLQEKQDDIEGRKVEIQNTIEKLRSEKSALQREYQKWQSLPEKIESEERQKAAHEQAIRDARRNLQNLEYDWDKAVLRRARLITRHKRLTDQIREAHLSLVDAKIRLIEAQSDVEGLKERNRYVMAELEEQKERVREATRELQRCRNHGQQLGQEARELLARQPEKQELLTRLADGRPAEDLEMEISAEEAKLELIHAANPNVMREFERRAEEITRIKRKMDGAQEKLAALEAQLGEVMSRWEPRLDELVLEISEAFAHNFEQISCVGEVRVHKDEDFSQWALDVMVKFREHETLQQLTAHRQSGGERAVSTIFYLMALQSLAQSPFRVVDEINQGMDPRNERMVHERMVEIACREHTSQYFLITPKLLTGLRYDAKMRILCIASGEHMPQEGSKVDFSRCIQVQRGLMASG